MRFIRTRELSDAEVLDINHGPQETAPRKYIAAEHQEWLYRERTIAGHLVLDRRRGCLPRDGPVAVWWRTLCRL